MEYTSLSIASFGSTTLSDQKKVMKPFVEKKLTDNSDIEGSSPCNKYLSFSQKYLKFQQDEVFQFHIPTLLKYCFVVFILIH